MKFKSKIIVLLLTVATSAFVNAQEKPKSPAETASGTINGSTITIKYGSPSVKGREIWGGLVPFDKVWRAGANEATTFETSKDIVVEGQKLPAGKYSFFVIPNKGESIVIFNKESKQWGSYEYKEAQDQLRVKVKPRANEKATEKLTFAVNASDVTLSWEKWDLPISIK